ncbi:MAG: hypothetical protein K6L76_01275 [Agarilytica sp.]
MKKLLINLAAAICVSACGSTVQKKETVQTPLTEIDSYALTLECGSTVPFSGYIDYNELSQRQSVNGAIYSGYDAVSFLATVLIHAATEKSVDHSRMKNFINESNELALGQCEPVLQSFYTTELVEHLTKSNTETRENRVPFVTNFSDTEVPLGYIQSNPNFILTKEHDSIIIENNFLVTKTYTPPNAPKINKKRNKRKSTPPQETLYNRKIIIIKENNSPTPTETLLANNGQHLKSLTKDLFYNAFQLFSDDFINNGEHPPKKMETIKYKIGGNFRVERGSILKTSCDRVTFKTLRGHIKSVPQQRENEECVAELPDIQKQSL